MNVISDEIKKISDIITQNYQVEEIFLFGSYARGSENEENDIDIYASIVSSALRNI